ncbi:MAG: AraC family transcriptional regulator [Bacteroidales bacterium]|nr:AraC family transcriptional regulator [Bacteroidales bacterium]
MKRNPVYEKVEKKTDSSFKTGVYEQSYFKRSWHFHPEAEILLITKGFGKRFIGDSVNSFTTGDLVLLGGNLPHAWISDPVFYEPETKKQCSSIFIQFDPIFFGEIFMRTPELNSIYELLKFSKRGLSIKGYCRDEVISMINRMPGKSGVHRFTGLLYILDLITKCEHDPLTTETYLDTRFYSKSTRINRVHECIMENFKQDISLKKAADIACMNESSFARFFKSHTGQTFSEYLNEIRVDFASKLLKGTAYSVSQIAYESGYNSLTYFNKKFKELRGLSPNRYRLNQKDSG